MYVVCVLTCIQSHYNSKGDKKKNIVGAYQSEMSQNFH